jgi:carboxymethylenebutenolidase
VINQKITIDTVDGPMPTYEAIPENESKGAILVVQEAFGVTSHIEGVAQRLAESGW